jgi:hypothetical protein
MIWVVMVIVVMAAVLVWMRVSRRRLIHTRGTLPVQICPGCGQPRGKCRHDTRKAETWSSFQGSLGGKKKRR